jgi:transposase
MTPLTTSLGPAAPVTPAPAMTPELPLGECAALVGLDWGDTQHAFAMWVRATGTTETGTVVHSAEEVHTFLDRLRERFGGQRVAVAVEASKGAIVAALLEHPWLTIYPVHPATSRRFNQAFVPSGAKDDGPDAQTLLEILRGHRHKLRALLPHDPETRRLGMLSEQRRALVDQRTRVSNQLTSLLKQYYPQALALTGDKRYAPLALAFLERWPELAQLQQARPHTVRAFFYAHQVRREETIAARLELLGTARALTTDRVLCEMGMLEMKMLVAQLHLLQKQIAAVEALLAEAFAAHPEAELFAHLPGAGAAMAPRLSVLFGTDRARWRDAGQLQTYYGIAPVTERSGRQCWVHWRWNAPLFARQTLMEWAGLSVRASVWAKAYYDRQKARQKGHGVILRALAFKWLRILWRCWQNREPYDEARYLRSLEQRRASQAPAPSF